jgi:mRNA-degrading endonuclease RelE of RelBE toxin-antitoxin system
MAFSVRLTRSADEDLLFYPVYDQRVIVDAVKLHLIHGADQETRRRKKLTDHPLASWELRVGDFRVFYDIEADAEVKVTAIGHKIHNALFVRGRKVDL